MAVYLYAEFASSNFPQEMLEPVRIRSKDALEGLWRELGKAQLFLSDTFYARMDKFQRRLWELRKAVSDSTWSDVKSSHANSPVEKRDLTAVFEEVRALESETHLFLSEFRAILGTNPARLSSGSGKD